MKQKVLLLIVLALGMCGTAGFAQKKEYKVGDDGFEWYEVTRTVNGQTKYGAEDRYGNMIVPTEYDRVWYSSDANPLFTGFKPKKGKFVAWYNKKGKCIIPYSRGYTWIFKWDSDRFGTYYQFWKSNGGGICDRNGREVASVLADGFNGITICSTTIKGNKYYYLRFSVGKNGGPYYGIADANGRIIVPAEHKESSIAENLAKSRLTTTNNPLEGNRHETLAEAEGHSRGGSNSYSSSSSSSSSSSGNSNSGNNTTTIHVEHHHDPVPVQQWQTCFGCGGMGTMGCDNCGGSGTKYIGDRLHRCSRCNGRGIIPCNICHGNKGQYITVYQ